MQCSSILTARRGPRLIYDYWIWKKFPRPELSISCNRQDAFTHAHTRHNNKRHIRPPFFFFSFFHSSSSSSSSTCWTADERLPKEKHKERTRSLWRNICLGNRAADAGPGIWPLWWLFRIINQKKRTTASSSREVELKRQWKNTDDERVKKAKRRAASLFFLSFFSVVCCVWVARTVGAASYAQ